MKRDIEILARGVCVRSGKVLLCRTKGRSNTYLPGGHIEFHERATKALEREIREELGLASRAGTFLGAVEHTFSIRRRRTCEINLVFELSIPRIAVAREPVACEDYIEFLWVPVQGLREARLEPRVLCDLIRIWTRRRPIANCWASTYGDNSR